MKRERKAEKHALKYGDLGDIHSFADYPDYGHEFAHPVHHPTPVHDMHTPAHAAHGHDMHGQYHQNYMQDMDNSQHYYDHHDTHHKDMEWLGHQAQWQHYSDQFDHFRDAGHGHIVHHDVHSDQTKSLFQP